MPNIFRKLPKDLNEEVFETLIKANNVEIERIVSLGHSSPENDWYDQERHEWVMVLQGEAKLEFENQKIINLTGGDYINIPAHSRHRVIWTTPEKPTIWLAIHYQ